MDVKLTKLSGRKANIRWDEKNQVAVQHVAVLSATGYVVATRRTPSNLDVAHIVNFDLVLCDIPYVDEKHSFEDRKFFRVADRPVDFHQFHLGATEAQMRTFERMIGKRIELTGLSSIVCWEGEDGVAGNLNCFSKEFLDMVDMADDNEYERGAFYENQGMTPCHVVLNPRAEEDPTYVDVAWGLMVSIVKAPLTAWKMMF